MVHGDNRGGRSGFTHTHFLSSVLRFLLLKSYQKPHAMHKIGQTVRFKPPNSAPIWAAAPGFTVFSPPNHGCVAPVNCLANHWAALIFSADGRTPLPEFGSDAPVTSWSSLRERPSAGSCCGPLPGSHGVSLWWKQHKSLAHVQ